MVRIASGENSWSGVLVTSEGLIFSASRDLGSSPVVSFVVEGGASGKAWVLGRDDVRDIAVYEILDPPGPYPSLNLSAAEPPSMGSELAVLSYPNALGGSLERMHARVVGVKQDFSTGAIYVQLQTRPQLGTQGGALIGVSGKVLGLRMSEDQMIQLGFGQVGEAYAITSSSLLDSLPRLIAGYSQVSSASQSSSSNSVGAPPTRPILYHGTVSIGGILIAKPARIYLKLTKSGREDLWFSTVVGADGKYVMAVQAASSYGGGAIEFWMMAKQANETPTFLAAGSPYTLNIAFP